MIKLAATLKLAIFLLDFTPEKREISFEQSRAAHTFLPKLFLQQLTAGSVSPTTM